MKNSKIQIGIKHISEVKFLRKNKIIIYTTSGRKYKMRFEAKDERNTYLTMKGFYVEDM